MIPTASLALAFDILARDRASKAFDSAGKSADGLKSKVAGMAKVASGALFAAFGKASVDAFKESEDAQNRLQASFAKSPALIGANLKAFNDLNSALATKTKFDDDATASGQAVLAQFGLTADQLKQVTPLLQDYAARTGKDLPSAAQDLGKAVLGQGRALKAIGLNLKDTGSAAGNFDQLMGGLRAKVGGFAEKEGKTTSGRLAVMSNQFGELQETVGRALVPALTTLATTLTGVLKWFNNLSPSAKKFLAVLAGVAGVIFGIVQVVKVWTAVSKAFAAVQAAVNVVLAANPIGLVVVAIAALVAGLILAYKNSETFRRIVDAAFRVVKEAVEATVGAFVSIGETVARVIGGAVEFLRNNWQNIILGLLTGGVGLAVKAIAGHFDEIVGFVSGLPGRILRFAGGVASAVTGAIGDAFGAVKNFVSDRIDDIAGLVSSLPGRILGAFAAVADLMTLPFRTVFNAIADLWNSTIGKLSFKVPSWIPGIGGNGFDVPDIPKIAAPSSIIGGAAITAGGSGGGLKLHSGGIVPGMPGTETWALLQAGETVIPAGKAAGPLVGALTQVFQGQHDPAAAARASLRELDNLRYLLGA